MADAPKALTLDDTIRKNLERVVAKAETSGGTASPEDGSATGADASKKGKSVDDILAVLPPEDRERVQKAYRGLQSKADQLAVQVAKLDGVDPADLDVLKAMYTDPALMDSIRSAVTSYQAGKLSAGAAKTQVQQAVEDEFEALLEDPNLGGADRAALKRLQKGMVQTAMKVVRPINEQYEQRLRTVEELLLSDRVQQRDQTLSSLKGDMGDDLYDAYAARARPLIQAGLAPHDAFKAVMSTEDLLTWLRPKQQGSLSRKKSASEITAAAAPEVEGLKPVSPTDSKARRGKLMEIFRQKIEAAGGLRPA